MKIARQPHGFASTPMNGKISPPTQSPKNHPSADKTSSGRVIDIMGGTFPGSLREGAGGGGAAPFNVPPGKRTGAGEFHRPYENSVILYRLRASGDTPSVSRSLDSSLREGAGNGGAVPFIGVLAKVPGYGRFSSPLRNSECLTAPIHRTTLPQSRFARQLPQGGSREGCVPFIGVLAKIRGCGRLSSPLRKVSFYQAS